MSNPQNSRSRRAAEAARNADAVNVLSKDNQDANEAAIAILKDEAMVPSDVEIVERDGAVYHEHSVGEMTVSTRVL